MCDELRFYRDRHNHRIEISFCYESSGCPGQVSGKELRDTIDKAVDEQCNN
jgi:hypothetical protein